MLESIAVQSALCERLAKKSLRYGGARRSSNGEDGRCDNCDNNMRQLSTICEITDKEWNAFHDDYRELRKNGISVRKMNAKSTTSCKLLQHPSTYSSIVSPSQTTLSERVCKEQSAETFNKALIRLERKLGPLELRMLARQNLERWRRIRRVAGESEPEGEYYI